MLFEAYSAGEGKDQDKIQKISHYFNRRFFKHTEAGRDYDAIEYQEAGQGNSLIIYEGPLQPTPTELKLA